MKKIARYMMTTILKKSNFFALEKRCVIFKIDFFSIISKIAYFVILQRNNNPQQIALSLSSLLFFPYLRFLENFKAFDFAQKSKKVFEFLALLT